jgi:X-X-X-Leu-X-X-Gly heptad repeat protein
VTAELTDGLADALDGTGRLVDGVRDEQWPGPTPGPEMLVHGWDLARATGQPVSFPEELAEQELAFGRGALQAIPPGRAPFGPPQPAAADAPVIGQLAALLGRAVTPG